MKMQIMNEVMEKYKKLKEKKQSQQKSIEEAKVRINDLSVASLFQRFYPQMHRIEISSKIIKSRLQSKTKPTTIFSFQGGINDFLKVLELIFHKMADFGNIRENRKYPLKKVCMLKEQRFLKNMGQVPHRQNPSPVSSTQLFLMAILNVF